jgi:hypothetical protein
MLASLTALSTVSVGDGEGWGLATCHGVKPGLGERGEGIRDSVLCPLLLRLGEKLFGVSLQFTSTSVFILFFNSSYLCFYFYFFIF